MPSKKKRGFDPLSSLFDIPDPVVGIPMPLDEDEETEVVERTLVDDDSTVPIEAMDRAIVSEAINLPEDLPHEAITAVQSKADIAKVGSLGIFVRAGSVTRVPH